MHRSLRIPLALLVVVLAPTPAVLAQVEGQPQPGAVSVQDGGTRETLEGIFIPPMVHAPFSLELATEWSRPLGNGGTYTLTNRRRIMRDSQGRIYEERWLLMPKGGKSESRMNYIQVADPIRHTLYNCRVETKTCFLLRYAASAETAYAPAIGVAGALPDGEGFRTVEELGNNSVNGLDTTGHRVISTINPGVYGNDQPMVSTREFWYAPSLGINLISMRDDPKSGRQSFTVTELSTSEPEPQFFEPPQGYKVVDQRKVQPASY